MNFILAVKRLMKEAAELKDPTDHYHAQPLEVSFYLCLQHMDFNTLNKFLKIVFSLFLVISDVFDMIYWYILLLYLLSISFLFFLISYFMKYS